MFEKTPVRKTVLLQLDVMVTEENEDYLEAEITHPRLSGALYLTVNSRKELEEEFVKIDLTGTEEEETSKPPPVIYAYNTPSSATSALPTAQPQPFGSRPALTAQLQVPPAASSVESLIKNTFNLTSGLMELRARLKK